MENLSERLPVANPRDELGEAFNELLARLEVAHSAAPVHGRRVARAAHAGDDDARAAAVALAGASRRERISRGEIVEQQAARLSRVVDDMFRSPGPTPGTIPCGPRRCTSTKS